MAAFLNAVTPPRPGILFHVGLLDRNGSVWMRPNRVPSACLQVERRQGLEGLHLERRPSPQYIDSALVVANLVPVARRRPVDLLLLRRLVEALPPPVREVEHVHVHEVGVARGATDHVQLVVVKGHRLPVQRPRHVGQSALRGRVQLAPGPHCEIQDEDRV